jgi:hypothetical protein
MYYTGGRSNAGSGERKEGEKHDNNNDDDVGDNKAALGNGVVSGSRPNSPIAVAKVASSVPPPVPAGAAPSLLTRELAAVKQSGRSSAPSSPLLVPVAPTTTTVNTGPIRFVSPSSPPSSSTSSSNASSVSSMTGAGTNILKGQEYKDEYDEDYDEVGDDSLAWSANGAPLSRRGSTSTDRTLSLSSHVHDLSGGVVTTPSAAILSSSSPLSIVQRLFDRRPSGSSSPKPNENTGMSMAMTRMGSKDGSSHTRSSSSLATSGTTSSHAHADELP